MPRKRIGVAVIGGGLAGRTHAFAYRNVAAMFPPSAVKIDLVAIADVDGRLAEEVALQFGFERAQDDWRSIASAPDIDAVTVALPNFVHEEVVAGLLQSGKHVLCEKPLASTAAGSLRLVRAASDAAVTAAVGFNFRCAPGIRAIRDRMVGGLMGEPQLFLGSYLTDYARDPDLAYSWRFDQKLAGGGATADVGAHLIDMSRFMLGEVEAVSGAMTRTVIEERRTILGLRARSEEKQVTNDDFAVFNLEFAGGATGQFAVSRISTGFRNSLSFSLVAAHASAQFDSERLAEFQYAQGDSDEAVGGFSRVVTGPQHPYLAAGLSMSEAGAGYGVAETFVFETRDFLASILNASSSGAASFTDGYEVALILAGVGRSVVGGGGRIAIADVRRSVESSLASTLGAHELDSSRPEHDSLSM